MTARTRDNRKSRGESFEKTKEIWKQVSNKISESKNILRGE